MRDAQTELDETFDEGGARRSRWWLALAIALVVGVGLFVWVGQERGESATPVSYTTSELARRDLERVVAATGTLSPVTQVQVGSQVTGTIRALHADFNDTVKAEQVIAEIDPRLYKTQVAQAEARLASARAALLQAEARAANAAAQATRTRGLADKGALSRSEVDVADAEARATAAQVEAARAQVREAKASRDNARTTLGYTKIVSPIDGVVVSRDVEVGQTVAASLQAPTLFVIAGDLKAMEVHTSVAEADIGVLAVGMPVEFSVDAFPGERFLGLVKQVRYAAEVVSNVVTYDAVVAVENAALKLRPGMTANVTFIVAEEKDVLAIPNAALRFSPSTAATATDAPTPRNGRPAVKDGARVLGKKTARRIYVLDEGTLFPVEVELGLSDGRFTEVTAGDIDVGARVVVGEKSSTKKRRRRGPPTVF